MEEPLPAGGSCLLGSINLAEFIIDPFTNNARIDYDALNYTTEQSVIALNEVLLEGLKLHPLEEQRNSVADWRQIGLGTMGLGDMLIKLGITYGSDESIEIIHEIFSVIAYKSILTSLELAKVNGCYHKCDKKALADSNFISFISDVMIDDNLQNDIKMYGLFNSQLLTCAPTGSIATMYQVSTGVEPNFAFEFNRRTLSLNNEETTYKVYAKIVDDYYEVSGISKKNEKLPEYFIASQQIDPINRIKVQSALQLFIDASISSTINLPEETTVEEIADIYIKAWEYGLKGVTIYRDNCQRQGILTTGTNDESISSEGSATANVSEFSRGFIRKVNDNCIGLKRTLTTGCGTLHCEAFFDPQTGELLETYLSKGSKGGCNNFMIGLSRMISLAARGGLSIDDIIDQLKSCGVCPSYAVRTATQKDTSLGSCCPVAVGNALKDMHIAIQRQIECCGSSKLTNQDEVSPITNPTYAECPECGTKSLIHTGGCIECSNCGYTKCS